MAKNVFLNDENIKTIEKIVVDPENGRAVINYGKQNFLVGGITAAAFIMTGYTIYKAVDCAVSVVKYLKT